MPKGILNKASLVMVPEAPIDGTMPSVFPEDRSGDFTFTRGSNLAATRVASNGLIEKGRENLLLQSNQFDTTWSAILGANLSGGQSGYDGSNDAWRFTKASGQSSRIYQNITLSPTVHTTSIYAKAGTLQYLAILEFSGPFVYFDLQNGTIGTISGSPIDVKIEEVGTTGWYRCSVTDKYDITQLRIYATDTDGSISGSGNIYIQDAQVEAGVVTTSYIESGATTGKAGLLENEPRIDFTGGGCGSLLLEPQRTNLITQSEYFGAWVDAGTTTILSTTTNPSGYSQSYIISAASSATNALRYDLTFSASTDYSYSLFLKAGTSEEVRMQIYDGNTYQRLVVNPLNDFAVVDQSGINSYSIEDFSNGWKRVSMNFSSTASAGVGYLQIYPDRTGNLNNVEVYGAQLEQGSYPTSYIPTHGNIVTRSDDNSSLGGLQTSSILNGTKGTLLFEGIKKQDWYFSNFVITTDGSNTNRSLLIDNSGSAIRLRAWDASSSLDTTIITSAVSNGTFKYLIRWDNGNLKVFINGVSAGTASINAYSYTTLNLKEGSWSNNLVNQVLTFPTALTDEECSALTQP